jgi:hypothetical protein
MTRGFGIAGSFDDQWPPYIVTAQAAVPDAAQASAGGATVTAEVRDNRWVDDVWAVVYPPDYLPPQTSTELVTENLDVIYLQHQSDGRYQGTFSGLSKPGTYRIAVHADDADGLVAVPVIVTVENGAQLFLPFVWR